MTVFDELKARGLLAQLTDEEEIKELINNGKAVFYIGFDPTADSLHVGHFMALCLMKRLQMAGNKPIALIGGGTAMIGDPSGRTDMRSMMTKEQIDHNCECFKKQMSRFIEFGEDKALMVNNADWLRDLNYIEFIRELSVKCRQNGLVLSVDNYVPKSFNTQYDRKEQGIVADYVVIMGYDEYYAGSPEAGPVSSYNYVKEGITETLKEVPAEKVISGIPFFTRLWKETPKTEEELKSDKGTDAEQYSATVESDAYGMDNAQAIVKQAGVDTTWDKKAGQNYATWEADGSKYEIWLEDSKSIEAKLKLMKKYKLAGTAEWSLGQESSDIWNLIQKYVN